MSSEIRAKSSRSSAGSPRPAPHQNQDFLRLLHGFWRSSNSNVCPSRLGLTGTLPVIKPNDAVEMAMRAASRSMPFTKSRFARKKNSSIQTAKGYRFRAYELPLATGAGFRNRIHDEKSASAHAPHGRDAGKSLTTVSTFRRENHVDFSTAAATRSGIVSERTCARPDEATPTSTPSPVLLYNRRVSTVNMEEVFFAPSCTMPTSAVRRRVLPRIRAPSEKYYMLCSLVPLISLTRRRVAVH